MSKPVVSMQNELIFHPGFFPDGMQAWAVNHDAGVAFQLPSAANLFELSSVNTHYNIGTHGEHANLID